MVARVLDSVKRYVTFAAAEVHADPLECADLLAFGSSDLSQYSPVKSVPRKECSADCRWPKQCQIAALQKLARTASDFPQILFQSDSKAGSRPALVVFPI